MFGRSSRRSSARCRPTPHLDLRRDHQCSAPIDIALTDQSERRPCSRRCADGGGEPTGFDPAEETERFVVSFRNCVVHGTSESENPES
jgi:hypothetical protein